MFPGAGDLVHGLARGRGGGGSGPARDGPDRGHFGQSGDRLLVCRPRGGSAARAATTEAAARCPQLHVTTADADRDARFFEGVIAAVDDLVPRAEVLRPGLLVLPVRGAARYFGSEQQAAERLIDTVAAAGAECQVGIADQLPPRSSPRVRVGSWSREATRSSWRCCRSGSWPPSRACPVRGEKS